MFKKELLHVRKSYVAYNLIRQLPEVSKESQIIRVKIFFPSS